MAAAGGAEQILPLDQCIDLLIQCRLIADLKPVRTARKHILCRLQPFDLPQTFFPVLLLISGGFVVYIFFVLLYDIVFDLDLLFLFIKLPVVFCQPAFLGGLQFLL